MNRWSKYTVGHYSAIKKKEVLPTATRIDLEGIMLNEITQRKTDTMWSDLYVKSQKTELTERENRLMTARSREWGMVEMVKKALSYSMQDKGKTTCLLRYITEPQ